MLDRPGGFAQSASGPHQARQNVYVGYQKAGGQSEEQAQWHLLPFLTPPEKAETAYLGENAPPVPEPGEEPWRALQPEQFERTLGAASDTWRADENRFGFSLLSPCDRVPDPRTLEHEQARRLLAPVVTGWIEYDNRDGSEPVQLMFGLGNPDRSMCPLEDNGSSLAGFTAGPAYGYATSPESGAVMRQGFDVFAPKFQDQRGLHVIGGETALVFTVPAGEKKRFPLALGFYVQGTVSTGIRAAYAYTRWFSDLEDVLAHGLEHFAHYEQLAQVRDRELETSGLDEDQRFLLAQSIHSYQGNTELLWNDDGPLWIVNEGEYRMINTFDLTVDHLFYELDWHPWAVRDTLDLFVKRYSYTDRLMDADGTRLPGGISFTHDMGVMDHFTPQGYSSYECDHLTGCFSHMTMEQLLNWVLTAVTYAEKANDLDWLQRNQETLLACAESMHLRDHQDPAQRNGILKFDSERCGDGGAEITTYDSLDVSLGQARNNLYLAVKTLGAWILLEQAFNRLNLTEQAADARDTADLLAQSVAAQFEPDTGFFPAVFEKGNRSRILPAVEGFVYPLYLGLEEATDKGGRFSELLSLLSQHISQALQPGVCLDAKTNGWKISSTSNNTWFSKIALSQHVIRRLFPEAMNAAAKGGDRVHADWQRLPGCGSNAMCDQIISTTGVTCGSRYYPRGVTAWLWLSETDAPLSNGVSPSASLAASNHG
ncbi:MAG: xylan 1 4-beta-xylosidase [Puniceicoccaceae bacterium 5H]|nr:MAG: xylan 1 4-beta-xylosidase [Puniceicoccaceae bacterium 5H]